MLNFLDNDNHCAITALRYMRCLGGMVLDTFMARIAYSYY